MYVYKNQKRCFTYDLSGRFHCHRGERTLPTNCAIAPIFSRSRTNYFKLFTSILYHTKNNIIAKTYDIFQTSDHLILDTGPGVLSHIRPIDWFTCPQEPARNMVNIWWTQDSRKKGGGVHPNPIVHGIIAVHLKQHFLMWGHGYPPLLSIVLLLLSLSKSIYLGSSPALFRCLTVSPFCTYCSFLCFFFQHPHPHCELPDLWLHELQLPRNPIPLHGPIQSLSMVKSSRRQGNCSVPRTDILRSL